MRIESISWSHQDLLSNLFKKISPTISEYTFANLYLFREIHRYTIISTPNRIWISGVTRDDYSFIMPTEALSEIKPDEYLPLLTNVDFLFPIQEEWLPHLNPDQFTFNYNEMDSDYLFDTEKMRTFKGRHLSNKRNLVKQLLTNHKVEYFPLTTEKANEALNVLEIWNNEYTGKEDVTDYSSCKEAIQLLYRLKLEGLIFHIDGDACAFLIGEKMNSEQYLLHFAKACRQVKGLNQYIYQALAQSLDPKIKFLNLEQDLGSPSMRQAKHSYHPDRMIHKWRVALS